MHLGYYSVRNMRNRHEERQTAPHGSRVRSRSQGTRSSAQVPECDRTGEAIRERSGAALRRGGDGIGRVAVKAVAGVIVPAGRAGVFVVGVVLHAAQGRAGVQGEGDRRVAQAVRRELLPRADPGRAGQAPHQVPQMALAQPSAGDGGQQRPAQLPPLPRPGPLRPVGQVGLQGRHCGRGERDLRLPRALADHPQHPVAGILAQVGDVGGASLIDAQSIVQQQPHHRRGAQRLGASVGIGGDDQGAGLIPVQAHRGRVVRIHHRPGHSLGGDPADQVVSRAVPVERGQRRQAAAHAGGRRSLVELGGGPQVDVYPPFGIQSRVILPAGESGTWAGGTSA
jgi:hypothetical protein